MIDDRELLLASLDNQHLLDRVDMASVVSNLCGLQAQFANNPAHALRFRAYDFDEASWQDGLVKTWTFRRTIHVVRRDELGLFLSAQGVPDKWDDEWGVSRRIKPRLSANIVAWIREGNGGREALKERCRAKGVDEEVLANVFHGWGGLLKEICQRGLAAYVPGTEKRFIACDAVDFMERDEARAILLRRYFTRLGPATIADCATFMGLTPKTVLGVLDRFPLPLQSVGGRGGEYFYLREWDARREIPECVFLAGFDQLLMAYRDRRRLVDDKHKGCVVTNTGIVHPTIVVGGRVRAKWRKDGKTLRVTPFVSLSLRRRRRVEEAGEALFAGAVREVVFEE